MERGNDIAQPVAMPATTANMGNVTGSVGSMSADVGGFDMGGINVTAAGGGALGGSKDKDDAVPRDEHGAAADDATEPGSSGT